MENNNIFLGKIEKAGCYVNNGKYGYFLTCQKKNYKLPEYLLPEEVTLDMAKRIIAYKQKISEQWLEKKENIQPQSGGMALSGRKNKSESEDEDEDDNESDTPPKKEMLLTKNKNK
jgi:topoisomerase IA-like protein